MTTTQTWTARFKGLSRLEKDIRDRLESQSRIVTVPAGTVIFGPGKAPENLMLLLDGSVRVQQVNEAGREIVLYRVQAGESCVLTTACLLAYEDYSAEGVAETQVQAAAIPRGVFDKLIAESPVFRTFVFQAYSRRITDLFHVIDEIAFQRMDIRLAHKLVELAGTADELRTTHQLLSVELGTAREVVSRQLAEFQRRGWVEQSRGRIALLDKDALANLAEA